MEITELITQWLLEESFTISKLEAPPGANIAWGIIVSTPGIPPIRFNIVIPSNKQDRLVLTMGVGLSPEHKNALEKLQPAERIRVIHTILSKVLLVCQDCSVAIQPNILNPIGLLIQTEVFVDEINRYGKSYFIRLLKRFINAYFIVVSGFNEWHPVIPPQAQTREKGSVFM